MSNTLCFVSLLLVNRVYTVCTCFMTYAQLGYIPRQRLLLLLKHTYIVVYSKFQTAAARRGADRNNNIVLLRIGGGDWRRRQLWRDAGGGRRMRVARILPSGLNAVRIEAGQCQCTLMTRRQLILHEQAAATAAAQNRAFHNSFLYTYPHSHIASTTVVPTTPAPVIVLYNICIILLQFINFFFFFSFFLPFKSDLKSKKKYIFLHS